MSSKFEIGIVRRHKTSISNAALSNSKRLFIEGEILMSKGHFARACHLFISGLEEFCKYLFISLTPKDRISEKILKQLSNHESKAESILIIIDRLFSLATGTNTGKTIVERARELAIKRRLYRIRAQRMGKMLEDTMYSRMKQTPNDQFEPDNNYWGKRAKYFHKILKVLIDLE